MTLASFLKVQKYAFLRPAQDAEARDAREVPFSMQFAQAALALVCILAGVFAVWVVTWLIAPAAQVLLDGAQYSDWVLG